MFCWNCGAELHGEPARCPDCGAWPGTPTGEPDEAARPLRFLGRVLIAGLAVITVGVLVAIGLHRDVAKFDRVVNDAMVGFGIVFIVWLWRARINAEGCGWQQRRARGWAFWGWVIPIVSLWIPFQLLGDIWRAGLPERKRNRTAWLPALWWVGWLLSTFSGGRAPGGYRFVPAVFPATGWMRLTIIALDGLALIAIIGTISNGPVGE
jgi:hypothetical protein